jgi:MFS family permease
LAVDQAALLPAGPPGKWPDAPKRQRPSFAAASTLIARNRLVGVLVATIMIAEILGFSSLTLLPTFARDVFGNGAAGLGLMTAARSIGGVVSLLLLARIGVVNRSGTIMLGAASVLGLALLAFAVTPVFELALGWLALVGGACAVLDTLSQMLIQQSVREHERGAAMGLWVFSVGCAPLGHLALGALAAAIGAPLTQALFGASLAAIVGLLALYAPLRSMR